MSLDCERKLEYQKEPKRHTRGNMQVYQTLSPRSVRSQCYTVYYCAALPKSESTFYYQLNCI